MRSTVDECPVDIILAPSGPPLTDLEYADNVVIFAESSTKLQRYCQPCIEETSRSPCSTSSEEFVGFELEEATWPKTKILDEVEEEDPQRGQAIQARRKILQNME
ncbi:hypothetical protein RB195_006495 [Necator americanus]|uniref:Reverse transcriptase domain-containing protein n=1 Tax=Necator americanus TaxID=51031 RepID=A0ABR1BUP9_NECAM